MPQFQPQLSVANVGFYYIAPCAFCKKNIKKPYFFILLPQKLRKIPAIHKSNTIKKATPEGYGFYS